MDGRVVALHAGSGWTGRDKGGLRGYRGLLFRPRSRRLVVVLLVRIVLGNLDLAQSAVEGRIARAHSVVMANDMSLRLVMCGFMVTFGRRVAG